MPLIHLTTLVLILHSPSFAFTTGMDAMYGGTDNLNERDRHAANNYIHDAHIQEEIDKLCEQSGNKSGKSDICENRDKAFQGKTWNVIESMMPVVSKAYATILATAEFSAVMGVGKGGNGVMPDFLQLKGPVRKNGEPVLLGEDGKEYTWNKKNKGYFEKGTSVDDKSQALTETDGLDEKQESKTDWCILIAAATELGSMAYLSLQNGKIQENVKNSENDLQQRMALEAIMKSQENLQYTSTIQAGGWGGTALCYTLRLATSNLSAASPSVWIRLSAATALTTFYGFKAKGHHDRKDAIAALLDSGEFPKPGDCNPHTKPSCFCAHKASYQQDQQNYMKYCVAGPLNRGNNPHGGFPCVTADGKSDPECHCSRNNSCMQARIAQEAMRIGLDPARIHDPLAGITAAQQGYGTGQLEGIAHRSMAMAQNQLKKMPHKNVQLNAADREVAKAFEEMGFPAGAAAQFAGMTSSIPANGSLAQMASLAPTRTGNLAMPNRDSSANKNNSRMKTGNTLTPKRQQGNLRPGASASSGRGTSAVEIENYAQIAAREAEITKDKSRPLFDIISRRYQVRAWQEFDEQMRKELQEK